jgi:aldehyde:ferredoxin oxidoreductase
MQPILKIDLTTEQTEKIIIPKSWEAAYLGGASLAARMLYDVLTPELDPLSAKAVLLLLNGPLSGTAGPTTGRWVICGKSPATGLWAESNIGGFWGAELRKAGYDGVWVTGKADQPVYIEIRDQEMTVRPAGHLWGVDTYEVQDRIREEMGAKTARIAGIGVAGENQVKFANILCDHGRVAGRTGLGAVMGSKQLKAIAVTGSGAIPVADPDGYNQLRSQANRELRNNSMTLVARELGTAGVGDYMDYLGSMPKRGYTRGEMPGIENISGSALSEKYGAGVSACHGCVVACGRVVRLRPEGDKQKGPEYETIVGFGPNLWISDSEFIIKMNDLCDRFGMDTISLSNTIGFAMRLYELGLISKSDTDGLAIEWGDQAVVETLVRKAARRDGFGALVAEGALGLEKAFDADGLGVQVNGLEAAYHDPRGFSGMALVYATSPRGACHNQSDYYFVDMGQAEEDLGMAFLPRQAGEEKAHNVALHQDWRTVFNAIVMCIFGNVPPGEVVALINAGCGLNWEIEDLLLAGERAWNLKRVINNRLGLRRENDRLPKELLKPLADGGAAGYQVPFEAMLKAYYQVRGWDWKTGFPSKEKLRMLGLEFAIEDLWGREE